MTKGLWTHHEPPRRHWTAGEGSPGAWPAHRRGRSPGATRDVIARSPAAPSMDGRHRRVDETPLSERTIAVPPHYRRCAPAVIHTPRPVDSALSLKDDRRRYSCASLELTATLRSDSARVRLTPRLAKEE